MNTSSSSLPSSSSSSSSSSATIESVGDCEGSATPLYSRPSPVDAALHPLPFSHPPTLSLLSHSSGSSVLSPPLFPPFSTQFPPISSRGSGGDNSLDSSVSSEVSSTFPILSSSSAEALPGRLSFSSTSSFSSEISAPLLSSSSITFSSTSSSSSAVPRHHTANPTLRKAIAATIAGSKMALTVLVRRHDLIKKTLSLEQAALDAFPTFSSQEFANLDEEVREYLRKERKKSMKRIRDLRRKFRLAERRMSWHRKNSVDFEEEGKQKKKNVGRCEICASMDSEGEEGEENEDECEIVNKEGLLPLSLLCRCTTEGCKYYVCFPCLSKLTPRMCPSCRGAYKLDVDGFTTRVEPVNPFLFDSDDEGFGYSISTIPSSLVPLSPEI